MPKFKVGDEVEILESFGYDDDGMEIPTDIDEIGKSAEIVKIYGNYDPYYLIRIKGKETESPCEYEASEEHLKHKGVT